jgi:mannitol/fructose-specific phosphotransferase system IIA component (Ntr-type)
LKGSIVEILCEKQTAVNVRVSGWEDAVRAAGRMLVNCGFAEESYIEGMLSLSKELGPYIVLAPGIAIPHARPEEGAIQVGFAALTLDPPVNFGNEFNDPVSLVIGFCSPGADAHVELLMRIARILGVENFLENCKAARTPAELAQVFNQQKIEC